MNRRVRIDEARVRKAVWSCPGGKAPGWDEILVEMLKEGFEDIKGVLVRLYRGCFRKGVFPNTWKRDVIRTLLKGNDKDPGSVKSFRPICFLPVFGKVLEKLVVSELSHVFYKRTSDRQFGYMKGKSTEDAIAEVVRVVNNRSEKYCFGIFLDMSEAFDRVWWPELVQNLYDRGVNGQCM